MKRLGQPGFTPIGTVFVPALVAIPAVIILSMGFAMIRGSEVVGAHSKLDSRETALPAFVSRVNLYPWGNPYVLNIGGAEPNGEDGSVGRVMKKGIALQVLRPALFGAGTGKTMLPWSTVSDLKSHIIYAYSVAACSDARPMAIYTIEQGSDTYHLVVVMSGGRWVIVGPAGAAGERPIWYGTFGDGDRFVIERALVGRPGTDVCPFLVRQSV